MIYLPDTNACIALLRQRNPKLTTRWQAVNVSEVVLCSVVVYELRHGAERSPDPAREHAKLNVFLAPFASLPFDDPCARKCAELRHQLELSGTVIGPHDLQIAAIVIQHGLTLVTHNTREFRSHPRTEVGRLGELIGRTQLPSNRCEWIGRTDRKSGRRNHDIRSILKSAIRLGEKKRTDEPYTRLPLVPRPHPHV